MHPMLNIAVRAARVAGKILVKNFGVEVDLNVQTKTQNDFVTELDKAAESAIIRTIQKAYPQHSFLAEESGEVVGGEPEHQWIIDPLDGTTNYLRGIPHFSISIAYLHKGVVQAAVVYGRVYIFVRVHLRHASQRFCSAGSCLCSQWPH